MGPDYAVEKQEFEDQAGEQFVGDAAGNDQPAHGGGHEDGQQRGDPGDAEAAQQQGDDGDGEGAGRAKAGAQRVERVVGQGEAEGAEEVGEAKLQGQFGALRDADGRSAGLDFLKAGKGRRHEFEQRVSQHDGEADKAPAHRQGGSERQPGANRCAQRS